MFDRLAATQNIAGQTIVIFFLKFFNNNKQQVVLYEEMFRDVAWWPTAKQCLQSKSQMFDHQCLIVWPRYKSYHLKEHQQPTKAWPKSQTLLFKHLRLAF